MNNPSTVSPEKSATFDAPVAVAQNRRGSDAPVEPSLNRRATDNPCQPPAPHNFKRRATDLSHEMVPVVPPLSLLTSMALVLDPKFTVMSVGAKFKRLADMRKIYSEVVGTGFHGADTVEWFESVLAFDPADCPNCAPPADAIVDVKDLVLKRA